MSLPDPEKAIPSDGGPAGRRSTNRSHSPSVESAPSAASSSVEELQTNPQPPLARSRTAATVSSQRSQLERDITVLSRIATQRSQHASTVGGRHEAGPDGRELRGVATMRATPSKYPPDGLPEFGAGKPYPPLLPAQEEYVVEFDGPDDPLHPQNWTRSRKFWTVVMMCWQTVLTAFSSAIFSNAESYVSEEYHVGAEVGVLGTSLFVLGFATGPMLWAPVSELRGRKLPLIIGALGFTIFQFAVATGKDLQTIMICRYFSGFFGGAPYSVVPALLSDIYNNEIRGVAITCFAVTVFCGPLTGPFIGGFISQSYLGWRWTQYLPAILGSSALLIDVVFLSETYAPIVLIEKASMLRRRTLNWGIHAKQEEIEIDLRELVEKNFSRPFRILFTEPIVLTISIYMAFIYGLLYLFLTAYALVFQGVHRMNKGVSGLPYFGMIIGMLIAMVVIIGSNPSYVRKLRANNNKPIPEWRLWPVMIGGIAFSGGLFWFGWSGYKPDVHWIVPTASGLLSGFGLLSIFQQLLNYIVDAYLIFAASAIAGNTCMRSTAGAVFPLFATYMFNGMGINWAGTLLGCVAAALVPIPFVLYWFGAAIRRKSRLAMDYGAEIQEEELVAEETVADAREHMQNRPDQQN